MYTCRLSFICTIIHTHSLELIHPIIWHIHRCLLHLVPDLQFSITRNSILLSFFFHHPDNFFFCSGYRFHLHSPPRPGLQVKRNLTQIQPCKCIPLYLTYSFLHAVMCIEYRRWKKKNKKHIPCVLATQFWQFSVDVLWISAPVARCWGCGCTALSGTIMRSWFQEDPCGISCMM